MDTADQLFRIKKMAPSAARRIFASDPRVFSVGVCAWHKGFAFRALRNVKSNRGNERCVEHIDDIPVDYRDFKRDPVLQVNVADPTLTGPSTSATPQRTLACGAELQNFQCDERRALKTRRGIQPLLGTLGCFVRLVDGDELALLTNGHVLSPSGEAMPDDIVYSDGCVQQTPANDVALYRAIHQTLPVLSTQSTMPANGAPDWSEADAAVAILRDTIQHRQEVETPRGPRKLAGHAEAAPGDLVYKRGRTTGYTEGVVDTVGNVIRMWAPDGVHRYWFRDCIAIVDRAGQGQFSGHGDSGAVIVRHKDNVVLGLHFSGAPDGYCYANEMTQVLAHLGCKMA